MLKIQTRSGVINWRIGDKVPKISKEELKTFPISITGTGKEGDLLENLFNYYPKNKVTDKVTMLAPTSTTAYITLINWEKFGELEEWIKLHCK